jgi:adenylate kinase family enzyme
VAERLRLYRQDTLGMIPYYRDQGTLQVISGQGGIEEIYSRILEALNKAR